MNFLPSIMNFYEIVFIYGSPIVAVLACLLNLPEIILLVRRYRKISKSPCERRTVPVILLTSLAISDFLVGFTVIMVKILRQLMVEGIVATTQTSGRVYRVLNFLFLRQSLLTSVFSLLALTLDRYLAVTKPLVYRTRISAKHGFFAVFVIWLSSFIIISTHYYFSIYGDVEELKYRMLIFPITILPACIAFTVPYLMILRNVFAQGRETLRRSANKMMNYQRHILERELKISRFAATVVCTFMICWLPLAIIGLVTLNSVHMDTTLPNLMFFLAFVNSVIDPLIYFAFKENFSKYLKKYILSWFRSRDALKDG